MVSLLERVDCISIPPFKLSMSTVLFLLCFSIELLQLLRELELHISKLTKTKCSYETFIERWSTLSKCFQTEEENNGKLLRNHLFKSILT